MKMTRKDIEKFQQDIRAAVDAFLDHPISVKRKAVEDYLRIYTDDVVELARPIVKRKTK